MRLPEAGQGEPRLATHRPLSPNRLSLPVLVVLAVLEGRVVLAALATPAVLTTRRHMREK